MFKKIKDQFKISFLHWAAFPALLLAVTAPSSYDGTKLYKTYNARLSNAAATTFKYDIKCSACYLQSHYPKTLLHFNFISSQFNSTLVTYCKASDSMIFNHLTVAYYSDTFHHVQTSQKMLCKWKGLLGEMSPPENGCHQLSQIRQTSHLPQGILFYFIVTYMQQSFIFIMYIYIKYLFGGLIQYNLFFRNIYFPLQTWKGNWE